MRNPAESAQKIGIIGGTFNPIHLGHLRAAEEIAEQLSLDVVYFMPTAKPPHKAPGLLASYHHRLTMLHLALANRPGFLVSDFEASLPSPNYTINTIKSFKNHLNSGDTVYFLVGLDSFMTLPHWYQFQSILGEASFVVFGRAGTTGTKNDLYKMLSDNIHPETTWNGENHFNLPGFKNVYFLPGGRLDISSTDLRHRLNAGLSIRYLVPEPVRAYLEEHALYRHN